VKRIDPAATPELYRRVGWKPIRFTFGNDDLKCGCLIGVLDKGEPELQRSLDSKYVVGLTLGFDGKTMRGRKRTELLRQGHADGRAAWAALVEAGMVDGSGT
jgi:hypothetical protein